MKEGLIKWDRPFNRNRNIGIQHLQLPASLNVVVVSERDYCTQSEVILDLTSFDLVCFPARKWRGPIRRGKIERLAVECLVTALQPAELPGKQRHTARIPWHERQTFFRVHGVAME